MTTKTRLVTVIVIACAFALTSLVAARQPAGSGQQKPQGGGMMSMEDMMKEAPEALRGDDKLHRPNDEDDGRGQAVERPGEDAGRA